MEAAPLAIVQALVGLNHREHARWVDDAPALWACPKPIPPRLPSLPRGTSFNLHIGSTGRCRNKLALLPSSGPCRRWHELGLTSPPVSKLCQSQVMRQTTLILNSESRSHRNRCLNKTLSFP